MIALDVLGNSLQVISELNQARKLIDQARHSHHALYRAFWQLSRSELCDILLGILSKAKTEDVAAEFSNIVDVVQRHLAARRNNAKPASLPEHSPMKGAIFIA